MLKKGTLIKRFIPLFGQKKNVKRFVPFLCGLLTSYNYTSNRDDGTRNQD